jgi:hypothetical protein
MNKIIPISIFILIEFFCSPIYAQRTLKISPNETKSLTNNTLWTLNATCAIQCDHQNNNKIEVNVIKNSGVINGKKLSAGHGTLIQVNNNSSVSVSAPSGTQINLINLGSSEVLAVCASSL